MRSMWPKMGIICVGSFMKIRKSEMLQNLWHNSSEIYETMDPLFSSVLRSFQLPSLLGVPFNTIMGELGLDKWPDHSNVPSITQNLNPILSPSQVVVSNLSIGLESCVSFVNQPDMIHQQDRCEEGGSYVDRPEENGNLSPGDVHARHDDQQGENKLEESHGGHEPKLSPDIERVEVGAVEDPDPHPGQEEDEVPVVEVPHAIPGKHAVMFPFENTNPTHCAVPSPRGRHCLTHRTIMPPLLS